jgi:hypothetical protein
VNLNCICRRLDQNNITGYLDLKNINLSGPLNLINLTGNNMGPDFTSFLLYSNISNLVSSGLSIMWVPLCNMHLTFHFIERYPTTIYVHYLVTYIINYIIISNSYDPTMEQMCYQFLSQLNKWNILTGLKTTLVVTTFGKMACQGWLMLKSITFAIVPRHHQKASLFTWSTHISIFWKTMCVIPSCLNGLGVTYGSNFLLDYEVKIWHLIN